MSGLGEVLATPLRRRTFLAATGGTAALVALPRLATAADSADLLVASRFAGQLGSAYQFVLDDFTAQLQLQEVTGLSEAAPEEKRFTALFTGPSPAAPGGQVGQLRGPRLPGVRVLLVPVGPPAGSASHWQLVVNSEQHHG